MFKPVMSAEAVTAFWQEHFPQVRLGRDLHDHLVGPGEAVLRLEPEDRHLRPGGTIPGRRSSRSPTSPPMRRSSRMSAPSRSS